MPIRLDKVPPLAPRPARPRAWLWLGLLLSGLLLGVAGTLLFGDETLPQKPVDFWGLAVGVPILSWCVLGFARVLRHIGEQSAADGWDEAREKDLIRKIRQGRRSQQVLGVSLYTALRAPGEQPAAQLDALLSATKALKAQPSRLDLTTSSHSRLSDDTDADLKRILLRTLTPVLADLAATLARLPDSAPLALLLEVDSGLSEDQWRRVWRKAWRESGIRQSTVPVEGSGLAALDQWLDQRIGDQALLMVVAVRFAPEQPEGTAEVAVGVLFGNRLTQTTLAPIAYLHRPEQERKPTEADLLYATRQALDWVPLEAKSIEKAWRVGIDPQRHAAIATVLAEEPMLGQQAPCDLDALLGHPGKTSPWLAIAAATQTIERGAGAQLIFSGGGPATAGLWGTVLMPVSALSK
ncbi:hypothetical protein PS862_00099 [Pseudomonas fluorescens]|uniref:Uncharacterized protein n=1 Tax=Pseudomonas fluorescens TaxID=294 RepID=A0A5E7G4Y0_PSEFL|nr:hypothetical protein [Pseudomonas fluorescens]VVO46921.1 hypothetical protein PS862_00099 [Pseudomonas fluorescens]